MLEKTTSFKILLVWIKYLNLTKNQLEQEAGGLPISSQFQAESMQKTQILSLQFYPFAPLTFISL